MSSSEVFTAATRPKARDGHRGLTVAVIVATTGRPRTSRQTVARLAQQTRPPDRILVVAVTPADVTEILGAPGNVEVYFAPRGLCNQRNHGLALLAATCELVMFFDDDFLPAKDYVENAVELFLRFPDIVGATGRVIADGANGPGIPFGEAEEILAADTYVVDWAAEALPRRALYGCNMVFRVAAIHGMEFDENLPLYAWQEDIDFSYRLRARGRVVKSNAISGVHMGEKVGRTPGVRLGYSQIANPVYLLRKKSIPSDRALVIMRNNIMSNVWRAFRPDPDIDRRGRLRGNLVALRDLISGKLHPKRILEDLNWN